MTMLPVAGEGDWDSVFHGKGLRELEETLLPSFLPKQRWFGGKSRRIRSTSILDWGAFENGRSCLALVLITYAEGEADRYLVPLGMSFGTAAVDLERQFPSAIVGPVSSPESAGCLRDGLFSEKALSALLALIAHAGALPMRNGAVRGLPSSILPALLGDGTRLGARRSSAEQSNSSIFFGDRLIMKLFRKQQPGVNPDTEIGRYLTEHSGFLNIAPFGGSIEYLPDGPEPSAAYTFAMLQGLVANEGDGWTWFLSELGQYYASLPKVDCPSAARSAPVDVNGAMVICLDAAGTLGRRTGELHLALGQKTADADFDPEPFSQADAEALRQEVVSNAARACDLLAASVAGLPEESALPAAGVLGRRGPIFQQLGALATREVGGMRIRVHGDYHLGQVLRTGPDFVILDFEGEPARSLAERRAKQSPLKDVAGMLRSFSYAAFAGLTRSAEIGGHDAARLEPWARHWESAVSKEFLCAYRRAVGSSPIIPSDPEAFQSLLEAYVLDKALYELVYELNNRPAWVRIPLHGILALAPLE